MNSALAELERKADGSGRLAPAGRLDAGVALAGCFRRG
jgi:hypothetical protein